LVGKPTAAEAATMTPGRVQCSSQTVAVPTRASRLCVNSSASFFFGVDKILIPERDAARASM